jgi:hypothetical protein
MKLWCHLLLAGVASAMTFDLFVSCVNAPNAYNIDGVPNRPLSIVAGDVIHFHFHTNCVGHPMSVRLLDGTLFSGVAGDPSALTLATNVDTPTCLMYFCTVHPTTMLGTLTVEGGAPCRGSSPLFPFTMANDVVTTITPVITAPVTTITPVVTTPVLGASATLYPIPTTTTTTIYPVATASATLNLPIIGCAPKACPLLLPCILPAVMKTGYGWDGCPGCPYCVNPALPCCPPLVLPGMTCRDCNLVYL